MRGVVQNVILLLTSNTKLKTKLRNGVKCERIKLKNTISDSYSFGCWEDA